MASNSTLIKPIDVLTMKRILNSKLFKILFVCAVLIITIKSAWPVTVL